MREKLSLERFLEYKVEIMEGITYAQDHEDEIEDIEAYVEELLSKVIPLQQELLSYDLSDIPFEAWDGFLVLSDEDHVLDFSGTNANIDFSIVDFDGNIKFYGCNIRNLQAKSSYIMPDLFDDKTKAEYPNLFLPNTFDSEFQTKYYSKKLTLADIANLSEEQLDLLESRGIYYHFKNKKELFQQSFPIKKTIEIFKYSREIFDMVHHVINNWSYLFNSEAIKQYNELTNRIKNAKVEDIKSLCYDFLNKQFLVPRERYSSRIFPELYKRDNPNIFLLNDDIPSDVKDRYFSKELSVMDLINYPDVFSKLPVENFINGNSPLLSTIANYFGAREYTKLVFNHPDVFSYLYENSDYFDSTFSNYLPRVISNFANFGKDAETALIIAIKNYLAKKDITKLEFYQTEDGRNESRTVFTFPDWAQSLQLKGIEVVKTREDLLNLDENTLVYNEADRYVINQLGLDNIKRIEEEFGLFSRDKRDAYTELPLLHYLASYVTNNEYNGFGSNNKIDFYNGVLTYPEFKRRIIQLVRWVKNTHSLTSAYNWLEDELMAKNPEQFLDKDAPSDLKELFNNLNLTPSTLFNHPEYIPYLVNKDLLSILNFKASFITNETLQFDNNIYYPEKRNLIEEYQKRYGNEKTLQLICKYGKFLNEIEIKATNNEIDNEEAFEKAIIDSFYNHIISKKGKISYDYLSNCPEFVNAHKELFLDVTKLKLGEISDEEKENLASVFYKFYKQELTYDDVRDFPQLAEALKDVDINFVFTGKLRDLEYISQFGKETSLQLMIKYGSYMEGVFQDLKDYVPGDNGKFFNRDGSEFTIEDLERAIQNRIIRNCKSGLVNYTPETAPDFLREASPELFLDEGAPQDLIDFYYSSDESNKCTAFQIIKDHPDWLPFLQNKDIKATILRKLRDKDEYNKYFDTFGTEKAIFLGIQYPQTVQRLLDDYKFDLLNKWYEITGGKFLPDYSIISNIPLEEADNFLTNADVWMRLMKRGDFSTDAESRDALAKVACIFGAFNGDSRGIKQMDDLLFSLPRTIGADYSHLIDQIDGEIEELTKKSEFFHENMTPQEISAAKDEWMKSFTSLPDAALAIKLLSLLVNIDLDQFPIDFTKPIMQQFYRPKALTHGKNNQGREPDGSYVITFNSDRYKNVTHSVRSILGTKSSLPILTPNKAHQLFGPAVARYDKDFREFFEKNRERILTDPELIKYIGRIQRNFDKIKTVNSNRTLTLDMAIAFVKANSFENMEVGNAKVADVSRIAGFTQEEFEVLQEIYNVGKQRTFSSIPRIKETTQIANGQEYHYEILSLDDPLALGIGELSDCCQRINDAAEMCMEHSMIDKNGRIFVIKDELGNVVAQSWVWRNKDVLCFDNIEIPKNAFERAARGLVPMKNSQFADIIFGIYKHAAEELIELDEKVYRELLDNGQITQEQYDGLRLGKITVGLGYNDIKNSILRNSQPDKGHLSRPLPFTPAVKLDRSLYIDDSEEQHILIEREDRVKYDGPTLAVHSDKPTELTDSTIEQSDITLFNSLALELDEDILDHTSTTPLEDIADSINLHSNNARAVIHPNYGIIYEVTDDTVKIGEFVFNTKIVKNGVEKDITDKVLMQLKIALDQIIQGKQIDMSQLSDNGRQLITQALDINEELDEERGVEHAR